MYHMGIYYDRLDLVQGLCEKIQPPSISDPPNTINMVLETGIWPCESSWYLSFFRPLYCY